MTTTAPLPKVPAGPPPDRGPLAAARGPHPLVQGDDDRARTLVRVGEGFVGAGMFTFIAGPCAVETPEQLAAACEAAVAAGATMLRGDLYKHRTSPYSFQGLGVDGLAMVAEQRARFGLPWVAEVLDIAAIDAIAEVVDVIRVGSRNMQNFDLLRACAQTGKPVMIKRGLSSTVEEWLLAAEYVAHAGNLDIILCERGIRTFEPSTRNTLDLSAVVVAQQRSHLPVIVDPSHSTGGRTLVAPMALAAIAAGADGIMVDVHADPASARCDGPQALLPDEVVELGARLRDLAAWTGRRVDPVNLTNEVPT
jgi:3-deoxy-7-phosphoheptulonate synthase